MIAVDDAADLQLRDDQLRLGLWMFLATVTMLFAAFISAYVVRRAGSDWRHIALPAILWLNTAVLLLSSAVLEAAHRAGRRQRWTAATVAFALSFAMGLAFLAGQALAWRQLAATGVYLPTSPHSSFFYMITAAHSVQGVAAFFVLGWGLAGIGTASRDPQSWTLRMDVCRTFWHYLGGLWVVLLVVVLGY